jgi:FKBP-type peptidyl-prolyl cis-trans isomerase SlyD
MKGDPLKIAENTVVSFEYTLTDKTGKTLDKSDPGEALTYMHGGGQIVPGLENAMAGHSAGDKFEVDVTPLEGYGERDPSMIFQISRSNLPKGVDPKVGMELASKLPDGQMIRFRLTEIRDDSVTADANHPLAGEPLHFAIEVKGVRAATEEEKEHGHVHGEGGHHHH